MNDLAPASRLGVRSGPFPFQQFEVNAQPLAYDPYFWEISNGLGERF